ncbi:MAG: PAS domain-containing sensor histidine kinase [Promethearchaeota archaeon]
MSKESERHEKILKESEEKYKLILDNANDLITIINEKYIHEYVNEKAYFNLLGYSAEDIIGNTPLIPLHPEDQKKALKILEDGFKYGKGYSEMRVRHKDGHYLWLENKGTTFTDLDKQKKALIISRDITERKKVEQKLRDSEMKYRNLILNIQDVIAEVDSEGNILYSSPQILDLLGYQSDEVIGLNFRSFIHPDDIFYLMEAMMKSRESFGSSSVEFKMKHHNGKYLSFSANGRLINEKGNMKYLAVLRDITEKKEAERLIIEENKKLLELSQIKRDLVSRVSHELKTPLSSIYAASQFLLQEFREQLEGGPIRFIEMIHKSGQKLKRLIEDLLDMSRVESGKLQLDLQNVDMVQLIKECINDLEYQANNKELKVFFDHPNSIFLEIDRLRMEQVIINILFNSIKFTPPGGEIDIKLTEDDKWIEISIRDTGLGLTKKEQKLLFQKFSKIKRKGNNLNIESDGSGLGLYISKEIVELHKGMILVDSKGRSKGSVFIVKLPKT